MTKKYWWSSVLADIKFCFVCGGSLRSVLVPADKKKRLVCRLCLHITYLNPRSVAGMIPVLSDGRVALLKRSIEPGLGLWTYPAGYQEMGESVAAAAARETREEIRVRVRGSKLLGVYSYPESGVVVSVFVGKVPKRERPRAGEESQDVKLFKPEDIPWNQLAFRSTRDALKDWVTSL